VNFGLDRGSVVIGLDGEAREGRTGTDDDPVMGCRGETDGDGAADRPGPDDGDVCHGREHPRPGAVSQ
jgi:hypothetical protein